MLISTIVPVVSSFALGVKTSSCWGAKLERNKTILKASENVAMNIQEKIKENFAQTNNETNMTLNQILEMLNKQSPNVLNELSNRISNNSNKNNYENNIIVNPPSPNIRDSLQENIRVGSAPPYSHKRGSNNIEEILQNIKDKKDINKLLHSNNNNYRHSSDLYRTRYE
jgi:hypothetical protein